MVFPPVPESIKSVAHILKVAEEHENRNIVVTYWARMYACQMAMKLIPGTKPADVSALLIALMDWMEQVKRTHVEEGITNQTVASALIEEYAMQLFKYADAQDRAENFSKNVIKAFYSSGILFDVLEQFGDLTDDIRDKRKYAKWKAAFIHNCLKAGETPTSGGPDEHANDVLDLEEEELKASGLFNDPRTGKYVPVKTRYAPSEWDSPSDFEITNNRAVRPLEPSEPPPTVPPFEENIPAPSRSSPPTGSSKLDPEDITQAQKYCKYATSALNHDDVTSAIENLTKALSLLTTGKKS